VKSVSLKKRYAIRGTRLIHLAVCWSSSSRWPIRSFTKASNQLGKGGDIDA